MRSASFLSALVLVSSLAACSIRFGEPDSDPAPPPPPPPAQDPPPSAPPVSRYSSDYEVGLITASMNVVSDGKSIHVVAALIANGSLFKKTFLQLDKEDRLMARLGDDGPETAMSPMPNGSDDELRYEAFLSPSSQSETSSLKVVVAFLRAPGRANAGLSEITLAPSFDVSNAPSTVRTNGGETLVLSNDAPTKAEIVGDCIAGQTNRAIIGNSVGTQLQLSGSIPFKTGFSNCEGVLDVRRETRGHVDSAFKRGGFGDILAIDGVQQRSFNVSVRR